MPIFVPHENVEKGQSFGQLINSVQKEYITPELQKRGLNTFAVALVEIPLNGSGPVHLDDEVTLSIGFKNRKVNPADAGKPLTIDLHEIKDIDWQSGKLDPKTAKILLVRFSKDWWILKADFKKRKDLEEKYRTTQTFKVRGAGYLPLNLRKQEKPQFMEGRRKGLEKELPAMWRRHITVSQRYSGALVYDGNYFDLFTHAQQLYILGHYFAATVVCRIAAEQMLVTMLIKSGKATEIFEPIKPNKPKRLKGIYDLIATCRDRSLFGNKYPIGKTAEKRLKRIANAGNSLVHLKTELDESNAYKQTALQCMDDLSYAIKRHLNFVKDTGTVSGYRFGGSTKRLK
jgi:hypothetical protein